MTDIEELRRNFRHDVLVPLVQSIITKRQREKGSGLLKSEHEIYDTALDAFEALIAAKTTEARLDEAEMAVINSAFPGEQLKRVSELQALSEKEKA